MPSPPHLRGARIAAEMIGHLITNVRILDGTGRPPFAGAVRVEGNRIAEVAGGR
jgi:N-acyl-D-aspartate/D-glutamate deacylase